MEPWAKLLFTECMIWYRRVTDRPKELRFDEREIRSYIVALCHMPYNQNQVTDKVWGRMRNYWAPVKYHGTDGQRRA